MATSRLRGENSVTSRPSRRVRPSVSWSSPATTRSRVVFPHPDGPTTTNIVPSATSTDSSSRATVPSRKTLVTSSRASSAISEAGPRASRPPHLRLLLPEDQRAQQLNGLPHALVDRQQQVLVLDAHHVVVVDGPQRAHDVPPHPFALPVPDGSERPRSVEDVLVVLRVEHAVAPDVALVDERVLGVHVEDRGLPPERGDGLDHVDALPEQVAGVEVRPDLRPHLRPQPEQRFGVVHDEPRM